MATILVDFKTLGQRDFAAVRPIGVWLTRPDGGIEVRYRPEVEDGADGHDNYLTTFRQLEEFVNAWRSGQSQPDFPTLLEYVSETTYLGHTFRTFGTVPDEVTVEEAYQRFVIEEEPLPVEAEVG